MASSSDFCKEVPDLIPDPAPPKSRSVRLLMNSPDAGPHQNTQMSNPEEAKEPKIIIKINKGEA